MVQGQYAGPRTARSQFSPRGRGRSRLASPPGRHPSRPLASQAPAEDSSTSAGYACITHALLIGCPATLQTCLGIYGCMSDVRDTKLHCIVRRGLLSKQHDCTEYAAYKYSLSQGHLHMGVLAVSSTEKNVKQ